MTQPALQLSNAIAMIVILNQVTETDLYLLVVLWAELEKLSGCKELVLVNKIESSWKVLALGLCSFARKNDF